MVQVMCAVAEVDQFEAKPEESSTEQLLDELLGSHEDGDFPAASDQSLDLCFDSDF